MLPAPWTTWRAVRIWPWVLMMTPEPREESWEFAAAPASMTTSSGRTELKMPTPVAGWFLRLLTALLTVSPAILLTSALLTAGFDELCTVIHPKAATTSAITAARLIHPLRRQRRGGGGGALAVSVAVPGAASVWGSTAPNTSSGAPYFIASTYCRLL